MSYARWDAEHVASLEPHWLTFYRHFTFARHDVIIFVEWPGWRVTNIMGMGPFAGTGW